ncbi:MAG: AAA family ATPase, partial [Candidatus Marinimicrobia bacterium]|nr:AAA family ATPase [Candidatus Neomarinimicrobiota bacterium]
MKSTAKEKQILNTFDDILMLSKGSTILSDTGLGFEGSGVDKITIGGWGDGHRATLAWLADLFSWDILYKKKGSMSDIVGIVLLDEIEHHLHPSWQRRIIRQLNRNFPKIQFIVTSHSPLCAIGTTDLSEDIANIFLLRLKNDSSHLIEGGKSIRGMRADQVLTSYLFGLESTRSDDTALLIE